MSKNIVKEPDTRRLGIPRAMLYYRYRVLWKRFFDELGLEVRLSPPTNRDILQQGTAAAMDEACLSTKIYLGHVRSLLDGCDLILVPRVASFGHQRVMCTKFQALYDLTCNTFPEYREKFISYNIDIPEKKDEEGALLALAAGLGFPRKAARNAYKQAKKAEQEDWKQRCRTQERLYQRKDLKLLLVAHSYVLDDPYIGRPVTDYLRELGVLPLRADVVDRKEALKQSLRVSPTLKWEFSRELVGSVAINKEKVDGIILMSAFPCGPDAMVNEMIPYKFPEIPTLKLVLDDQSGTAGMETRLESFVDIIRMKKGVL
ncbi:MAG: acyl-CoA dehydratase activase-related protein [Lachnospiraceae bacterium]|nr:acyl-CoA dehydratase activase-related protein [Lachnospiraceae bacterium]